jgi:uncharacterized protein (DUF4415 family)
MPEKRGGTRKTSRKTRPTRRKGAPSRHPHPIDWARIDALTDAEIAAQVRAQPDEVEFTDAMFAEAHWIMPAKKVPISFRVDPDVLAFFRREGEGYQSRMNAVLRGYMRGHTRKSGRSA